MIRLLVAAYPRKWRARYGEEFTALLQDTRLTPLAVFDVLVQAGRAHAGSHRRLLLVLASLAWYGFAACLCLRAGLTANIAWAPTTPARALALAAATGPLLWLAGAAAARRLGLAGRAASDGAGR